MYIVDSIFPLTLALSLIIAMTYFIGNLFSNVKFMQILVILPLMAAAFDYTENIIIISQLLAYPGISSQLITISSWLTGLKFLFLFISASILIIFLIVYMVQKRDT
jgi:hypothetical protein